MYVPAISVSALLVCVQFVGAMVADDYAPMSYNYYDEIAQATCSAAQTASGYVFAVRRNCDSAPTCNDICNTMAPALLHSIISIRNERRGVACFDALHLYKNRPLLKSNAGGIQTDHMKVGLATYRYFTGGCTWRANHCGPNYCCCKSI